MKTIFTLLMSLFITLTFSQEMVYVHTTTAGNISVDASYLDHPSLNGNPNARLLVTHNYNPPGSSGVYNDHRTGVFYSNAESKWTVYNEDSSNMIEGASFNIYISQSGEVIEHIATLANQGSNASYSVVDHPSLNGNPDANVVMTTYYNPNSLRNDHNYGFWYDDPDQRWNLYTEDGTDITLDSAFFVAINGANNTQSYRHQANAGNITGHFTILDHPLLNDDPNAVFVITHNWGISGDPSNVIIDNILSVWYTGTNWSIYTEDFATMPEDAEFDIIILDTTLGIGDNEIEGLSYAPNPTNDYITVSALENISKITMINIIGQHLRTVEVNGNSVQLDLSDLNSGIYLAKVETENSTGVIEIVKQ